MATKTEMPPIYDPPPPPPTFGLVAVVLLVLFGILHLSGALLFEAPATLHTVLGALEVLSGLAVAGALSSWRKRHHAWALDVSSRLGLRSPTAGR